MIFKIENIIFYSLKNDTLLNRDSFFQKYDIA